LRSNKFRCTASLLQVDCQARNAISWLSSADLIAELQQKSTAKIELIIALAGIVDRFAFLKRELYVQFLPRFIPTSIKANAILPELTFT